MGQELKAKELKPKINKFNVNNGSNVGSNSNIGNNSNVGSTSNIGSTSKLSGFGGSNAGLSQKTPSKSVSDVSRKTSPPNVSGSQTLPKKINGNSNSINSSMT